MRTNERWDYKQTALMFGLFAAFIYMCVAIVVGTITIVGWVT